MRTWAFLTLLLIPAALSAQCVLTFSPASGHAVAAGNAYVVDVAGSMNTCPWTSSSNNPDWLTISFGQAGNNKGSVGYVAKPNTFGTARTGTLNIGSQQYSVLQDAAACAYSLTPATASFPTAGGNGTIAVATKCTWLATSTVPWIVVNSGTLTGDGNATYSVAANTANASRTGAIQIGSQQVTVTQFGLICTYTVTPATVAIPATGGTGQVAVQTDKACSWTAQTAAPWITASTAPTLGPATYNFQVAANTTATARQTSVTVAGQLVTVNQTATGIRFTAASVVNAASFSGSALAPGEIFTIFGSGLGPATLAYLQLTPENKVSSGPLGGTRVLFDGTPAPLIYTQDGQLSAIAPYSIAGNTTTQMIVEVNGTRSAAVTLNVTATAPALFTSNASGSGQAAALNLDYSANTPANPASAGSILQLFGTGEGATNPAGIDGLLAIPPFPQPLQQPVTAQIGGVDAQVLYAGAAPAEVAGVFQVNVRIPPGAPTGSAVPLVIRVGTTATQPGITVAIR